MATVVLLLSILVPLVNSITICLLMVPLLVQYVKLDTKRFLLFYGISLVAVYLVTSLLFMGWVAVLLIAISLFFLPPVIQMGNMYKKRAPARSVLTAGTVTLIAELLLSLIVSYAFGLNLIDKMKQFMLESIQTLPVQMQNALVVDKDLLVQIASQLVPLYMIGFSFFLVLITHWLSRKLLNRSGEKIPGLKPIREWKLHRSLVWYYVIALFMEMLVKDTSSILFTMLLNLLPLLTFLFAVQAISFLFFVAHIKGWNRALPIVAIVISLVFAPAYFILSLLGVFDVAFPLRERVTRK
ncbi:DUF2232 domain-containing protein [Paenibacillus agricola]|uniref:DUF2232 domain-containing protein n=1 Tax=Paenibacillus agricola TaxID=2716264 RepID=UPI001FB76B4A|nr:DUF2232 domain-containing protein [Paenibacillus agricola]